MCSDILEEYKSLQTALGPVLFLVFTLNGLKILSVIYLAIISNDGLTSLSNAVYGFCFLIFLSYICIILEDIHDCMKDLIIIAR